MSLATLGFYSMAGVGAVLLFHQYTHPDGCLLNKMLLSLHLCFCGLLSLLSIAPCIRRSGYMLFNIADLGVWCVPLRIIASVTGLPSLSYLKYLCCFCLSPRVYGGGGGGNRCSGVLTPVLPRATKLWPPTSLYHQLLYHVSDLLCTVQPSPRDK